MYHFTSFVFMKYETMVEKTHLVHKQIKIVSCHNCCI